MRSDFCQTQWLKTRKIRGKTGSCRNEAVDELREFFIKGGGEGIACGKCCSGTSQGKTFEKGTYRYFRMDDGRSEIIQKGAAGCRSAVVRCARPFQRRECRLGIRKIEKAPAGQNAEGKRDGRAGSDVKIPKKWNGPSAGRQKARRSVPPNVEPNRRDLSIGKLRMAENEPGGCSCTHPASLCLLHVSPLIG